MIELINNPWTVGIGGGILSGLGVTIITRLFLEKKDDREILERVNAANKELIYAIRPCIAEGAIPSIGVVESLINSSARKYRLDVSKLSTPKQLIDDLMKEVMDSSFISAATKAEYCKKLDELFQNHKIAQLPETKSEVMFSRSSPPSELKLQAEKEARYTEYRQKLLSMASLMMGVMAAIMTASFAFLDVFKSSSTTITLLEPLKVLLPAMATVFAVLVTVLATRVTSRIHSIKNEKKHDHDESPSTNDVG